MIDSIEEVKGMFFALCDKNGEDIEVFKVVGVNEKFDLVGVLDSGNGLTFQYRCVSHSRLFPAYDEALNFITPIAEEIKKEKTDIEDNSSSNRFDLKEALSGFNAG